MNSRAKLLLVIVSIVTASVGCRGRCNNGGFACSPTIAPPPTYGLNIPSLARNQPYYTPGAGNLAVDPNAPAPIPGQPNQPRWRAVNPNPGQTNPGSGNASSPGQSRSVLQAPTTFVETQSRPNLAPAPQLASSAPLPGSGVSFTNSQNYQTTQTDERSDSTRLVATDASAVRAPSRNFPTGSSTRIAQAPNAGGFVPPGFQGSGQPNFVAQNGFNRATPYFGTTYAVPGQPVIYQGQNTVANLNPFPTSSPPTVLAQASTSPGGFGWRNRELSSDRVQRQ